MNIAKNLKGTVLNVTNMKRIIHWYRAYKWLKKMKREKIQAETSDALVSWILKNEVETNQKMNDLLLKALVDNSREAMWPIGVYSSNIPTGEFKPHGVEMIEPLEEITDRPRNWNKFGWRYFNKYNGWNWLLTKTER